MMGRIWQPYTSQANTFEPLAGNLLAHISQHEICLCNTR